VNRPYEMRLRDVLDVFRRRRRFAVSAFSIALAAGVLVSAFVRPPYRASATITAAKTPPVVILEQPGVAGNANALPGIGSPDVPTLVALVKSQTVRDDAIARLAPMIGARRAQVLLNHLRVRTLWNTELVSVSVEDHDRNLAAAGANAVTASLVEMDLQDRRAWAKEMRRSVEEQLVIVDPRLHAAEDALVAFKTRYGNVPLSEKTVASLNRLAQLEAQRVDVRVQSREVKGRVQAVRSRLAVQARISPFQWMPSPLISSLETQLASEEIELSGLRGQFTPKHPAVVNVEARIAETKRRLNVELGHGPQVDRYGVDPVYQQLIQQVRQDEVAGSALDARDQALTSEVSRYEGELQDLPALELTEVRLIRSEKEADDTHQLLTAKLQQALVAEASIGSVVRIIDSAQPPLRPMSPRWLGVALGGCLGLLLGFGGSLVKEQIDDPIKGADHAERALGAPVLASIPRPADEGRAWPVLADHGAPPAFAESFRYLRTSLLHLRPSLPRTILVTSPGDGGTTAAVANQLAVAFAEAGLRTWLVDCDLRTQSLTRARAGSHVRAGTREGIAEWLTADMPEADLLLGTATRNLTFVAAGTPTPNAVNLLGGPRMRAFLRRDREDVDVTVVAAPPVLAVADAAALAPLVDGVVLVVRVGVGPQEAAEKAKRQLEAVGGRLLGLVVFGVPSDTFHAA